MLALGIKISGNIKIEVRKLKRFLGKTPYTPQYPNHPYLAKQFFQTITTVHATTGIFLQNFSFLLLTMCLPYWRSARVSR